MSEKPTGVFVRLPITDDQAQEMYRAYCAAYASSSLTTRGTATQAALLAIGMPVRGAELEVVGWGLYPAGGSNLSIFTNSGRAVKWANHFGRTLYPIVRQSDAQAQIAARDAEIVRLRDALVKSHAALKRVTDERFTSYRAKNGREVSVEGDDGERCDIIHSDITTDCEAAIEGAEKALKGGAA
ncbi:hypothetical protein [Acetobacter lambici]|uniref:Uncharacterized protein n=1 Tax=Acetobacter lambici TaxID=1332824 RepID=A0ABT1EZM2_9PROT|nr:hypothetical protein [Acetobacter lambici]MCP1243275.1 hypothetical protein [Acetobacter lambici]MCP1258348.1 hypothetical protein [Acetobacter lambici]